MIDIDKDSKDFVEFTHNFRFELYEEATLCASLSGLSSIAAPAFGETEEYICLAYDGRQKAEYATFEAVWDKARNEMIQKLLEYGAPQDSLSYWKLVCPIGKEKRYFEKDFPFKERYSDFASNIPNTVPIDWVGLAKFAVEFKKQWVLEHHNEEIVVKNKERNPNVTKHPHVKINDKSSVEAKEAVTVRNPSKREREGIILPDCMQSIEDLGFDLDNL